MVLVSPIRIELDQQLDNAQATIPARVVDNPVIGDRVTFLQTTQETNGEYLLIQVELTPHGGVNNPLHYHLTFKERFEVRAGRLHVDIDGESLILNAGVTTEAPIGSAHRFYNSSDEPVMFLMEIRPARQFEQGIRVAYGLARDDKTTRRSIPKNIWHAALVFDISETYLRSIPVMLQKAIFSTLARIARRRGIDNDFAKYL